MKKEEYQLDYPEAARVIALYLDKYCDKSLTYPNMIAEAARVASEVIKEYDRVNRKYIFMLDNGLGWGDMANDITYPKEL